MSNQTNDEKTIEEAAAELHTAIDAFAEHWKRMRHKAPRHFPEKINTLEWFEQFLLFLQDYGSTDAQAEESAGFR